MKRRTEQARRRRQDRGQKAANKQSGHYHRGAKPREPFNPLPGLALAFRQLQTRPD